MCKETGQGLSAKSHAQLLSNPVAVQLGLDDPNGPASVLAQAQAMSQLSGGTNVVYMYLLVLLDSPLSLSPLLLFKQILIIIINVTHIKCLTKRKALFKVTFFYLVSPFI